MITVKEENKWRVDVQSEREGQKLGRFLLCLRNTYKSSVARGFLYNIRVYNKLYWNQIHCVI